MWALTAAWASAIDEDPPELLEPVDEDALEPLEPLEALDVELLELLLPHAAAPSAAMTTIAAASDLGE
jgi:hypothetical protein